MSTPTRAVLCQQGDSSFPAVQGGVARSMVMSSNRERRQSTLTLDQKVGTRVSDRYWPLRQALGKDRHGVMQTRDVFADMRSGHPSGEATIHWGEGGHSDSPPNLPSGDPGKELYHQPPSEKYRENFAKIEWSK